MFSGEPAVMCQGEAFSDMVGVGKGKGSVILSRGLHSGLGQRVPAVFSHCGWEDQFPSLS